MEKIEIPFCELPQIDRSVGFERLKEQIYHMHFKDFPNLFSPKAVYELQDAGLNDIGSVMNVVDRGRILSYTNTLDVKYEAEAAVKLIRCEYFDRDPLIQEDDVFPVEILARQLGFSVNAKYLLNIFNEIVNTRSFFTFLRDPYTNNILSNRMWYDRQERALKEILEKASIVMRYHDRTKAKETDKGVKQSLTASVSAIGDHKAENEQKSLSDIYTLEGLQRQLMNLEALSNELSKAIAETEACIKACIDEKIKETTKGAL